MRLFLFSRRAACFSLLLAVLVSVGMAGCTVPESPSPEDMTDVPAQEQSEEAAVSEEIEVSGPGQVLEVTAIAEMRGERFDLEVATTRAEQSLGLMYRLALPDNRGMLFPFEMPRRASFWMKNVPVPLDIVFIRNRKVIAIAAEVPPCENDPCPTYGPGNEIVDTVLEIRSGRAAEIGLQPGDSVDIEAI